MPRTFRLRIATEHDLEQLVTLENRAFATDRFTEDQIHYLLTGSRATTIVLENKVGIAGSACLLWRRSHQGARLYNIAIDPAFQGKGLGDELLTACELEATRRGCQKMVLEVREDNSGAIAFYKNRGYVVLRSLPDYYSDGTTGLKMTKVIETKVVSRKRYEIPYYSQTLDFTCGPACLMMALKHFQPEVQLTRALEMALWKEATLIFMTSGFGGTDGYGLALSALNRNLGCQMVMSMDGPPMLKSVRIPVKREVMKVVHHDLKRRAKQAGLGAAIYDYGIEEIISALHRRVIPLVLISTYRLTGDKVPHWVVVTGCDRDSFYIHDPDADAYRKKQARSRHLRVDKTEFLRMTRFGKEVYRCLLLIDGGQSTWTRT